MAQPPMGYNLILIENVKRFRHRPQIRSAKLYPREAGLGDRPVVFCGLFDRCCSPIVQTLFSELKSEAFAKLRQLTCLGC